MDRHPGAVSTLQEFMELIAEAKAEKKQIPLWRSLGANTHYNKRFVVESSVISGPDIMLMGTDGKMKPSHMCVGIEKPDFSFLWFKNFWLLYGVMLRNGQKPK